MIDIQIEALQNLSESIDYSFSDATNALLKCINNRGKIVVVGIGKSGNIGHKVAATLNSTGSTAVVLNSQNALHGDLGIISDGDAVIMLSFSGETAELIDLIPHIKRFNVSLIAITKSDESTLAQYADITLVTPITREACPLNLAPTSSSTAALVMGDALAMALLEARGFTEEDFARFHPGGSLGRALLTSVRDIMRTGKQVATVSADTSVAETIAVMSDARTGTAIVVEGKERKLLGVFSHGDFARNYSKDSKVGEKPVSELMHPDPVTIGELSLATEAVRCFENHRVDDLVVVNAQNHVVGLVDSQDLARLKIV